MCHRNHVKTIMMTRMTREPVTFPGSDLRFEHPQLPNLNAAEAPALCGQTGSVVPVGGWPTERQRVGMVRQALPYPPVAEVVRTLLKLGGLRSHPDPSGAQFLIFDFNIYNYCIYI